MKTTKKIGIVIGVIIIGFIILSGIGSLGTITAEDKTLSKYEGLTQGQISMVRIIEDSCDRNTKSVYATAGTSASEIYAKKCGYEVSDKIDEYRHKNIVNGDFSTKNYSICHSVANNLNCLQEVAINENDPEACYEILNSPVGREQMYDENTSHLEYRKDLCLSQLEGY